MTRDEILTEAVEQIKTLPKLTAARQLHRDYPEHFATLAAARMAIQYRTGALGASRRNRRGVKEIRLSTIEEGLAKLRNYEPEPLKVIQLFGVRALVLSDIHIPYQDHQALRLALETAKEWGVDTIVLNGDVLDFYQASDFDKDPKRWPIPTELEIANAFLDFLQGEFPGVQIIYKEGNHDLRLKRYIRTHAKELDGMKGITLEEQLNLEGRGIEYVSKGKIRLGKLNVVHGHEFGRAITAPVNPARGLFLRAKTSAICGHHHQVSEHSENDLDGGMMACWSTGCLCDLSPDYMQFAALKWAHGFALVEVDDDGLFTVQNKRILNGKVH